MGLPGGPVVIHLPVQGTSVPPLLGESPRRYAAGAAKPHAPQLLGARALREAYSERDPCTRGLARESSHS